MARARYVSFCTRSILHGRLARSKQAILPILTLARGFGSMVDGAGYEFPAGFVYARLDLYANFEA